MSVQPLPAVIVIDAGGLIAGVDERALLGTRFTVSGVRRDGTDGDIDLVITGVRFGQAVDVTRAEVAEHRLATLVEALGVGVLLQDEQHRVVLANRALVELLGLGLPPEHLRGVVLPTGLDALADAPDGRVLEPDCAPVTVKGVPQGRWWVLRDGTAQADIRRGQQDRARLSALKTEFVATVSHELRTPLTSIATFANMLDESLPAAERTAAVAAIRRNAARMLHAVADLVLLAKLESGEILGASEPVDPAALVRRFDGTPAVRTEVSDGAPITGDPELLGQLVDTVVGVLLDASVAGSDVFVRAEPEPDGWLIAASTSAADAATAEWLLSTRVPAVADADDAHRTGALALMLARAIAARHGGQLEIATRRPGASVTVRLPFRA
jgi:signal transduction histidine kinase